jgi:aspartyl aminopeptidase
MEIAPELVDKIKQRADEIQTAREKANQSAVEPLPGAASKVWIEPDIVYVGSVKLRRLRAGDILILKKIRSPIFRILQQATNQGKTDVEFEPEEEAEFIYLFTREPDEIWNILKQPDGVQKYRQQALKFISKLGIEEYIGCIENVQKIFIDSFSSRVQFEGFDEKKNSELETSKTE